MAIQMGGGSTLTHGDIALFDTDAAFTWMVWFRRVGAGNFTNDLFDILKKGTNCYLYCSSNSTPNGIACYDGSGGEQRVTSANLLTTSWRHVCGTNVGGGTAPSVILDGISQTMSGVAQTFTDQGAANLQWTTNAGSAFEIAHFKIWSRAFSLDEILAERYAYVPVVIPTLQLWCPYDDGTLARDYSGQNNHGTASASNVPGPVEVAYDSRVMLARARRGSYGRRNAFRRLAPLVPMYPAGV